MHNLKYSMNLLLLLVFISGALSAQVRTIAYQPTDKNIANPERGWYDQYTTHSGGASLGTTYNSLRAEVMERERTEDNITLILRLFMLHEFLEETSVSEAYLEKMQADFDSIRAAGVKSVVRFAYSLSQSAETWDATPEKVFSHIESLGDVLSRNSDVIAAVQAGFIGAWGEWYYTKNFAGQGYVPDETDQQNRRTLVESLLNVLPENIVVEGRTPAIMKNLTGTEDPISADEAYDGSFKSRIGHHNDCFVASSTDYGTYTNLEEDLAYLHETTKYTITGGETCNGSNSYSDCANSVSRLVTLHWTYMNRGYNRNVYDKWKEQGCFEEINISLGYRFQLDSAVVSENVEAGASLDLALYLTNSGYAAATQFKPLQIVLIHTVTREKIILPYSGTNSDIRFWLPGEIESVGTVAIPAEITEGNYHVAIRIPDQSEVLAENPAYSVQLANAGTWDQEHGINYLNHILSVGTGGTGALPVAPSNLEASTVSETQIDLAWADHSDNETGFEIMRAEGEMYAWEPVETVAADVQSYSDHSLEKGKYYHYILRAINDFGFSEWTRSVTAPTLGVYVDEARTMEFSIYPNPLKGENLTISFSGDADKHIMISDLTGRVLYEKETTRQEVLVSRGIFEPGLYIVTSYLTGGKKNNQILVVI